MRLVRTTRTLQLLFALLFALTPLLSAATPPVRVAGKTLAGVGVAQAAVPSVTATKSDGVASGVKKLPGDTIDYTIRVSNGSIDDATGASLADTVDPNTIYVPGSLQSTPIARGDSYRATGNVRIQVPASSGVLANDSDPDGDALSVSNPGGVTAANGDLSLGADGAFTYNPAPGFEGTDTFTYTVSDGSGKSDTANTATASITVSGMIWFVNGAASTNGDGRLTSPFQCLVGAGCLSVAAHQAGDNIFLYGGTYTGGLTLLANEKLIGQGATASLSTITGITPPAGRRTST